MTREDLLEHMGMKYERGLYAYRVTQEGNERGSYIVSGAAAVGTGIATMGTSNLLISISAGIAGSTSTSLLFNKISLNEGLYVVFYEVGQIDYPNKYQKNTRNYIAITWETIFMIGEGYSTYTNNATPIYTVFPEATQANSTPYI